MSSELPCISMNLIELRAVLVGHPVARLDLAAALHVLEELRRLRVHPLHPLPNDR